MGCCASYRPEGEYCRGAQQSMQQAEYAIQTYAAPADRGLRIRIAITESGPEDWSGGTYQTGNDLGHQLVIFDSTASLLQWPRLDYLMFWNTRWYPNGGSIYDALDVRPQPLHLLAGKPWLCKHCFAAAGSSPTQLLQGQNVKAKGHHCGS